MAVYFCVNCNNSFVGTYNGEYVIRCQYCLVKMCPMYFSYVVPLHDTEDPSQYTQLLCYPIYDQVINSPIPANYAPYPYEQALDAPPAYHHMDTVPPYGSDGSVVHSVNSMESSEPYTPVNEITSDDYRNDHRAKECLKSITALLKGNGHISYPMRRKLGNLVNCQLNNDENKFRALRVCFSIGERVVFECMRDTQTLQDSISNLLASIRSKGCQFLGLPMQDEILKLILLAYESGEPLTRKDLVSFVLEKLSQHRQTSKKKIGDVVQLLYRACCFNINKREEMSALMQLKEELRNYDTLREQHDAQIVQIASDAGIYISPLNWASLLYNNVNYTPYMQSVINNLKANLKFEELVKQFEKFVERRSNLIHLKRLCTHLKNLASIDPSAECEIPTSVRLTKALDEVYHIVKEIIEISNFKMQSVHNNNNNNNHEDRVYPITENHYRQQQSVKKYKPRLCQNIALYKTCPRGNNCKFVHTETDFNFKHNIS